MQVSFYIKSTIFKTKVWPEYLEFTYENRTFL